MDVFIATVLRIFCWVQRVEVFRTSAIHSHFYVAHASKEDLFPILYDLYDLARVGGWEPYSLHDLCSTYFLDGLMYYEMQTPHNLSQLWQVRNCCR